MKTNSSRPTIGQVNLGERSHFQERQMNVLVACPYWSSTAWDLIRRSLLVNCPFYLGAVISDDEDDDDDERYFHATVSGVSMSSVVVVGKMLNHSPKKRKMMTSIYPMSMHQPICSVSSSWLTVDVFLSLIDMFFFLNSSTKFLRWAVHVVQWGYRPFLAWMDRILT